MGADEFLFLCAVVPVFVFGPGRFSLDWILTSKLASPRTAKHVAVSLKTADAK